MFLKIRFSSRIESTGTNGFYKKVASHKDIYIPNRLLYGTKSASEIYQKIVEKVLQGIFGTRVFLDDIIIT